MPLGINDLKLIVLPGAIDVAELERRRLRDGTTYAQMIADINAAMTIFNGDMDAGWLSNLYSVTTDPIVEYRAGSNGGFEDETEYSQPDAYTTERGGHMLPMRGRDRKLEWTNLFLENARRVQLDDDIASAITDAEDLWERQLLIRLFQKEADTGKRNGLGATGVSVPFVDGGDAGVAYTPPARPNRGGTFDATHDHFLRLNGITQANLEAAVIHLWEHGHDGPFDLLISSADIAAWTNTANVTGFKARGNDLVAYGANETRALVDPEYLGVIETRYGAVRVRANGRIPTGYWAVVVSRGQLDMRNPLKVLYDEQRGRGLTLAVGVVALYPLTGAVVRFKFGVGVGPDRTTAVLVRNAGAGDYATPVIA